MTLIHPQRKMNSILEMKVIASKSSSKQQRVIPKYYYYYQKNHSTNNNCCAVKNILTNHCCAHCGKGGKILSKNDYNVRIAFNYCFEMTHLLQPHTVAQMNEQLAIGKWIYIYQLPGFQKKGHPFAVIQKKGLRCGNLMPHGSRG